MNVLSHKAALVAGGLAVYLNPKLAFDAKVDLPSLLKGVTAKGFKEQIPTLTTSITQALDGKLAKDASLADLGKVMDELAEVPMEEEAAEDESGDEPDPNEPTVDPKVKGMDDEGVRNFLKEKLSEDDMTVLDALCGMGAKDEPPAFPGMPKVGGRMDAKDMVSKTAMDEALEKHGKEVERKVMATQTAIREAEEAVRPYVGKLVIAHDSAEGVYRTALKVLPGFAMDSKELAALPLPALKAVLKAQPLPGKNGQQPTSIAMDAATTDDFNKRYTGAARIGHL